MKLTIPLACIATSLAAGTVLVAVFGADDHEPVVLAQGVALPAVAAPEGQGHEAPLAWAPRGAPSVAQGATAASTPTPGPFAPRPRPDFKARERLEYGASARLAPGQDARAYESGFAHVDRSN